MPTIIKVIKNAWLKSISSFEIFKLILRFALK